MRSLYTQSSAFELVLIYDDFTTKSLFDVLLKKVIFSFRVIVFIFTFYAFNKKLLIYLLSFAFPAVLYSSASTVYQYSETLTQLVN